MASSKLRGGNNLNDGNAVHMLRLVVGKVVLSLGTGGGNTFTGLKRGDPKSQRRNTTKYIHTLAYETCSETEQLTGETPKMTIPHQGSWRVGAKSHGCAAPAMTSLIWCASNLIFIDDVSFKLYVSHRIYFTVVSKTKIVFCSKLCFY